MYRSATCSRSTTSGASSYTNTAHRLQLAQEHAPGGPHTGATCQLLPTPARAPTSTGAQAPGAKWKREAGTGAPAGPAGPAGI